MKSTEWLKGCSFSILGDSYSTFAGYIPEYQDTYYPKPEKVPDLTSVEETWWNLLMQRHGMKLLINDSYSGSTVCCDVRDGQPLASAFVVRMKESLSSKGIGSDLPKIIFLFGATNDCWLGREVGCVQYEDWTQEKLRCVLPAYCCMIDYTMKSNPQAQIVCIVNDLLSDELHTGIRAACEYYSVLCVELKEIDKRFDHPTRLGMQQIADQVELALQKA